MTKAGDENQIVKTLAYSWPEIWELTERDWKFDKERYPNYPESGTDTEKFYFEVRHILFHLTKHIGLIGTTLENIDHSKDIHNDESSDSEVIDETSVKLLLSVIKLLQILSVPEDDARLALMNELNTKSSFNNSAAQKIDD